MEVVYIAAGLPAPIGLEREGYFSSGENELFECDTVVSRDTCSRSWRICRTPNLLFLGEVSREIKSILFL